MALHLIKLAVGVDDLPHLRKLQKVRRRERGRSVFYTRHMPRRSEEILEGGSIYWVIKGHIRVRQRILGFVPVVEEDGERYTLVRYDPKLVETAWQPKRPFQGWRYLLPKDAPPDRLSRGGKEEDRLPEAMAQELRSLGLL
ncbi:MAG TPA: DUF1489 domain-containing protein [Stellaceae bacterium]|nr:DUF1489 domain-containing protein [Stellaceae bacterium]